MITKWLDVEALVYPETGQGKLSAQAQTTEGASERDLLGFAVRSDMQSPAERNNKAGSGNQAVDFFEKFVGPFEV